MNHALKDALDDFKSCKKTTVFSQFDCEDDWQKYVDCKTDYQLESVKFTDLINERNAIVERIKDFMDINMTQTKAKPSKPHNSNQDDINMMERKEQEARNKLVFLLKTRD